MSDVSQGPGWWQAADLKWYPPELHSDDEELPPPPPDRPPPPIGTPPPPKWDRKPLAIAAGAVIVVIVAATAGYFLTAPKPQPSTSSRPFTMSQPSSTLSQPPSPTVAPIAEAALDGLLLSPDQINTTMGSTEMTVTGLNHAPTVMDDDIANVADAACRPLNGNLLASAYAGSGWTAFREQVLRDPGDQWIHDADQGVVLFASARDADAFFTASAQSWPACANRQYTYTQAAGRPDMVWSVGPVSNTNGTLSYGDTLQALNNWNSEFCQRVVTVANNVVIDIETCSHNQSDSQSDAAVTIAHQIAAKIPT
jgi:serine/threonine kinase PknH